jgi:hypothetical protein
MHVARRSACRQKNLSPFCELFGATCLALPAQMQYEVRGTLLASIAKQGDNPFKKSSFQQYATLSNTLG